MSIPTLSEFVTFIDRFIFLTLFHTRYYRLPVAGDRRSCRPGTDAG